MLQKSEKIIFIKLQNLVLKKIFSELILILNDEINDIEFILFNPSDKAIDTSFNAGRFDLEKTLVISCTRRDLAI